MAELGIDYALLPTDGFYNMGLEEAMECADLIGAKHTIPIHHEAGRLYDDDKAKAFTVKSALLVRPWRGDLPLILPMELAGNFT